MNPARPFSLDRAYAAVFGVVYTLVGAVGFAFAPTLAIGTLLVFQINALHNVVHLLFGLAGLAAYWTGRSLVYARVAAVLFAVLALAGFLPQPLLGLVPLGGWDIGLHAATAVLAALAGWVYPRRAAQPAG